MHIIRPAVGIQELDQLISSMKRRGQSYPVGGDMVRAVPITTRNYPAQAEEILESGGSVYWIIKRAIQARQKIVGFERLTDDTGKKFCAIWLDATVIPTHHFPRKPFQGWRYFNDQDTPPDLKGTQSGKGDDLPPELLLELRKLGL